AVVGFDLAHAIGNLPMQLHDQQVDFAVWCSYKYLNSGPGGVGGIFVHEKNSNNWGEELPRFAGWWGHNEDERFKMLKGFKPMPGADGWQISNVNILSTAAHLASLQIFEEAGIRSLRDKSIKLTGFLEFLLDQIENPFFEIITPRNPDDRGCQLSLLFRKKGEDFFKDLTEHGFIVDWRKPDVIRIAPVPLYNTFEEVFNLANKLKELHNIL
ncbi:MAG: kynureninase, partial [Bacteroidetes bacterium]|nr:kynureninase [Bacteroidota bacterium]